MFPQGGEQVRRHAVKADFRQAGSAFLVFVGRFKLGQAGQEVLKGVQVGGALEEVADGFALDAFHQGDEEIVSFRFVFHQGVFLPLGAEAHAFPQGVHVVQVFLPHFVNGPQDDLAFHVVQVFRAFAGSLVFISGLDLVNEEGNGVVYGPFFQLGGLRREPQREGGVHPGEQFVRVGDAFRIPVQEFMGARGDYFFQNIVNHFARVFRGKHFIPVSVNDFALLVHYVVIVQHVLAPHVVALFHPFLGGFHGFVQETVFQRFTVGYAQAFHHLGHAFRRAEVAHQVVFKGDEEL